jgi:hypothetical protein
LCATARLPLTGRRRRVFWDPASAEADNRGTIIVPASHPATDSWKRLVERPLSVKWFGARGHGQFVNDGEINVGADSRLLISSSGSFTAESVGKHVIVSRAGPIGADLETIIESYISSAQIRLAKPAVALHLSRRLLHLIRGLISA